MDKAKILTISSSEYFALNGGMGNTSYRPVGVQVQVHKGDVHEAFAMAVPEAAEVVVNYRSNVATAVNYDEGHEVFRGTAEGTALVPRNNE